MESYFIGTHKTSLLNTNTSRVDMAYLELSHKEACSSMYASALLCSASFLASELAYNAESECDEFNVLLT